MQRLIGKQRVDFWKQGCTFGKRGLAFEKQGMHFWEAGVGFWEAEMHLLGSRGTDTLQYDKNLGQFRGKVLGHCRPWNGLLDRKRPANIQK